MKISRDKKNANKKNTNKKNYSAVIIMTVLIVYMMLPLLVSFVYSVFEKWTEIIPVGFSLRHYVELIQDPEFLYCILRTIVICIFPIGITVILVLLSLFVATVYFPRLEKYIQIICMIPYTIQGVILSVSILSLYVGAKSFLSNRLIMLFGAYCIIILPYIYPGIRNGMRAVNIHVLLEAAQMLGTSKIYAFFKIIVPNILSSIVVSCLLAVGIIFGDYVLVRNLAGTSFSNLQIYLYQTMKSDSGKASAVFVVIMFITFIITAAVLYMNSRQKDKK